MDWMKKGNVGSLVPVVISFVIVGIVLVVGLSLNSSVAATLPAGAALNATTAVTSAISVITSNLGLIATVIVFGLIIYLVLRYLGGVGGKA